MNKISVTSEYHNLIIASKPLQLLTAISVAEQIGILDDCDIFLVGNFSNSKRFSERYNFLNKEWPKVYFLDTFDNASIKFLNGKYSRLLVDSDIGLKRYLEILKKKINSNIEMFVYEEGQGTYRDNIRVGVKKYIFSTFGIGYVFGSSIFTSKIFLYNSKKYSQRFPLLAGKVVQIKRPVIDFISDNLFFLNELFQFNQHLQNKQIRSKNAFLVLMEENTSVEIEAIHSIKYLQGDKFVKNHPHTDDSFMEDGFFSIKGNIPAELVLFNFSNIYNHLIVFHFNTSTRNYIRLNNISYLSLAKNVTT